MSEKTGIEWTDATWNPWMGCHKVSAGCKNCYMFREQHQYGRDPNVVRRSKTTFTAPLNWKEPRRIFTCSWSDWFIEEADPWRDEAWDVIRRTPQHTYQILTKRIERAEGRIPIPVLPNVWLGVSVEDEPTARLRIPALLRTAAAVRFVSYEPALGPVDFIRQPLPDDPSIKRNWLTGEFYGVPFKLSAGQVAMLDIQTKPHIEWVIVGGESGPNARPFELAWARSTIEQCAAAGVPLFVKQLGALPYGPVGPLVSLKDRKGGDIDEWPIDLRVRQFPILGAGRAATKPETDKT